MKKYTIAFLATIIITMSSCEKETYVPQNLTVQEQPNDSMNFNLYWSSNQLGITLENVKPSKIQSLTNFNSSTGLNEEYGKFIYFYSEDSTKLIQFVFEYGKGITESKGRIDGKTFIMMMSTSTINICGSYQNVAVEYDVFYKGQINS